MPLQEHGLPGVLVALRHGVHAFGVLYADRPSYAVLVEDDELMLKLFVDAVGPAIHHGIRMLSSERAERWGAASAALTERLLADEQADPSRSSPTSWPSSARPTPSGDRAGG